MELALSRLQAQGKSVARMHLRHLWPLPSNLGELLAGFDRVLVPELNAGQLLPMLRSEYLADARGLNKVAGQPFRIAEIEAAINACLED